MINDISTLWIHPLWLIRSRAAALVLLIVISLYRGKWHRRGTFVLIVRRAETARAGDPSQVLASIYEANVHRKTGRQERPPGLSDSAT